MGSSSAFQAGWNAAGDRGAERRRRKEKLSDEEFQFHADRLGSLISDNQKMLSAIDKEKNPTEYAAKVTDLQQNLADVRTLFHPDHHEDGVAKFGHILTDKLGLTNPQTRIHKVAARQAAATAGDQREAQALAKATPNASPEYEAGQDSRKKLAQLREAQKNFEATHPNATPEQKQQFLTELTETTYGIKEKSTLKLYALPDGTKAWLDASRPDLIPAGSTAVAPGAARAGGGTDFWKTLIIKYGEHPTAAQIEAERQRWLAAGARGSETRTTVDAAGNSHTVRVPTFAPGQTVPQGLIPPQAAAPVSSQPSTLGDLATPQDWAEDVETPPDIEAPLAPARPLPGGGASALGGASASGAGGRTAAPTAKSTGGKTPASVAIAPPDPVELTRLEPLGITAPSDPFITDTVPQKVISRVIRPMSKDVQFGKEPARAILEEGIFATSLKSMGEKVAAQMDAVGKQIDAIVKDPKVASKQVNLAEAFAPFGEAIEKAAKDGDTALYKRLRNIEDELSAEWEEREVMRNKAVKAPGAEQTYRLPGRKSVTLKLGKKVRTVPTGKLKLGATGPRSWTMSPADALEFKRLVGDRIRWSQDALDEPVNGALAKVYGGIKDRINDKVEGLKTLNNRYSDLVAASKAIERRAPVAERQSYVDMFDVVLGGTGHWPLLIAKRAAQEPLTQTLAAQGVHRLPRVIPRTSVRRVAPVAAAIESQQPKSKTLQEIRALRLEAEKRRAQLAAQ